MKRILAPLILLLAAVPAGAADSSSGGPPVGFRLVEMSSASVNGEVLFLSDVRREACIVRCGVFGDPPPGNSSLAAARDRLVSDTLVLQEQATLRLGDVDNAALFRTTEEIRRTLASCADPCAREIGAEEARRIALRRLLVRDFLRKRIHIFIDVTEEEIRRKADELSALRGTAAGEIREEARRELVEERAESEIRNWFARAASKAKIHLAPMETK